MSEDITFRINADESGAVASFKRVRAEVMNNEKQMERFAKQGKMTSIALKDAASVLGPEFGILGDRIDHITGAMADFKKASLAAKASLVTLVAVGTYEVSMMIAKWIMQTNAWKKANEEALKGIVSDQEYRNKLVQEHFDLEMKIIEQAFTEEQRLAELRQIQQQKQNDLRLEEEQLKKDQRKLDEAIANDMLGFGKDEIAISETAVKLSKEKVKLLNEQLQLIDKAIVGPSERELELQNRIAAKQAKEREMQAKEKETAKSQPGQLQAQQQRMITRGTGGRDIDRLIEIAKQQQALAQRDAAEQREIKRALWQIRDKFPDEVFE